MGNKEEQVGILKEREKNNYTKYFSILVLSLVNILVHLFWEIHSLFVVDTFHILHD